MSKKILVVEDNADNMKLMTWVLEDEGYDFTGVTTAEAALEIIDEQGFDLVLKHISLPGMDGKEPTRRLRADNRFQKIPILAVTAHAIKGEDEEIIASGVTALATKPIDEEAIVQTINGLLKNR